MLVVSIIMQRIADVSPTGIVSAHLLAAVTLEGMAWSIRDELKDSAREFASKAYFASVAFAPLVILIASLYVFISPGRDDFGVAFSILSTAWFVYILSRCVARTRK